MEMLNLVIAEDNQSLLQPIQETEIKEAIFQMAKFKAPGPDGIKALFSKTTGILLKMMSVLL